MTKKEKKMMAEYSDYIQEIVKTKKVRFLFCAILPHLVNKLKLQEYYVQLLCIMPEEPIPKHFTVLQFLFWICGP